MTSKRFRVGLRTDLEHAGLGFSCASCNTPCRMALKNISDMTMRVSLRCPQCKGSLVLHVTKPAPALKVLPYTDQASRRELASQCPSG